MFYLTGYIFVNFILGYDVVSSFKGNSKTMRVKRKQKPTPQAKVQGMKTNTNTSPSLMKEFHSIPLIVCAHNTMRWKNENISIFCLFVRAIVTQQPFQSAFREWEKKELLRKCRHSGRIQKIERCVWVMWAKQFSEYLLTERNLLSGKTTCETIECWTIQWTQYKPDSSNTNNVQSAWTTQLSMVNYEVDERKIHVRIIDQWSNREQKESKKKKREFIDI